MVYAGDIVHQDDVAPKKPGCDNNFVLANFLNLIYFSAMNFGFSTREVLNLLTILCL